MVYVKHEQTGCSLESAVDELQKDFEVAMETVVTAIRANHGVTEAMMTQAMMAHQGDAEVQTAITTLREAMGGKPPPNYGGLAAEAQQSQQQKRSPKRGGSKARSRR